jgi:hypothetical protein
MRLFLGVLSSFALAVIGPICAADFPARTFNARWITTPGGQQFEYGVHHFRKTFDLAAKPAKFTVHVTADNRYQLFVNGERVCWGPARGDTLHWRYETVDIAAHLRAGKNVLAAVVWNFGPDAPLAQITEQTGFLLQGDTQVEAMVNTGQTPWKCTRNEAYSPIPLPRLPGYLVIGPGERLDAARYPWGWEQTGFDDSRWIDARPVGGFTRWELEPRPIPAMEEKPLRLARVRRSSGITVPEGFPSRPGALRIPANTKATVLLDQDELTTGYPELLVSGGKGARVTLTYAELLRLPGTNYEHGNRNEIEGKTISGYSDSFLPDGGEQRAYRTLWWRTWRYIELYIETGAEPLTIDDLSATFTAYPFVRKARFEADDPDLDRIQEVGWRTARLCAHETYVDCPWWEQLQYSADTRIQALISIYNTGDTRLMKNAIDMLDSSRSGSRPTFSRAPSRLQQYIPAFSLWWIGMIHDYWMFVDDPAYVKEKLAGTRAVLDWFRGYERPDGTLKPLPWWNQVDTTLRARQDQDIYWSLIDGVHLLALQWQAEMEAALGSPALAAEYRQRSQKLGAAIRSRYWSEERKLFAEFGTKDKFTQPANALAILAGIVPEAERQALINRVLDDSSLTMESAMYFSYYLHSAVAEAGAGDRYLSLLDNWRRSLKLGFTTFPEFAPETTRSDCHAWSAHPLVHIFRTILGVDSAAPGFKKVVIRPNLGKLTRVSGAIPHPNGEIAASFRLQGGRLSVEVALPQGVSGEFVWRGQRRALVPGRNAFTL